MSDYSSESFYTSKEYSLEELKSFLNNIKTEMRIRNSLRKNHYLSSNDFSFITWDTFSKLGFIDKLPRSDEDVKRVEERLDYLNNYMKERFEIDGNFIIIPHNKDFFLYDSAKYSYDEIKKIINDKLT